MMVSDIVMTVGGDSAPAGMFSVSPTTLAAPWRPTTARVPPSGPIVRRLKAFAPAGQVYELPGPGRRVQGHPATSGPGGVPLGISAGHALAGGPASTRTPVVASLPPIPPGVPGAPP